MTEPGIINHPRRARQVIDFVGLDFGTVSPTDIDCFIDFNNRDFVFIEAKYGDAPLKDGQRLALERLCKASRLAGRRAIAMIARHNVPAHLPVRLAEVPVFEYCLRGEWKAVREPRPSVRDALEIFAG